MNHYLAFGRDFFDRHQRLILWILNAPLLGRWGRWILRIHGQHSSVGRERIERIVPNAIFWGGNRAEFRTHDKYSKRLYHAFRLVWWVMHFWDWVVADRVLPTLSFGFSTLTKRPAAGANSPMDGEVENSGATYATVQSAGTGSSASDSGTTISVANRVFGGTYFITRLFALFDTSDIPDSSNVTDATLDLFATVGGTLDGNSDSANVYASTPASDSSLTTGDFDAVGTTALATAITFATISAGVGAYVRWTLNASGIAAVSKTGITRLALRVVKDVSATQPGANSYATFSSADESGTSQDPTLVVTYSTAHTTTLNENVVLVDTAVKQPSRALLESVNPVDVFTSSFIYAKILLDSIIPVDTIRQVIIAKLLAEGLALGDSMIKAFSRTLSDPLILVDVFGRVLGKTLTASFTLVTRLFPYLGGLSAGVWRRTPRTASNPTRHPRPE